MWEWLERLLGQNFMPHGHCYLWSPAMVWTQVGANLCIGFSYAAITAALALLVRRVRNIPFAWVYIAFGTFILSCGLTHFFDVITVWHPIYWGDAGVRVLTATASLATAALMVPMIPKAVAFAEDAQLSRQRGRDLEIAHQRLESAHALLEEREQEAQLRARTREGQLRSLVETMPQLSWIADPSGQTIFRNGRWKEFSGLDLDDPADLAWQQLHHPDTIELVKARWFEAVESGTPYEAEALFRRADGEYRWFLVRASALRGDASQVLAWMGTCTDVHDQRLLHEQTLRTAQMKDEFLATVSHELRTPLNAILGWSRMLNERPVSQEIARRALASLERNAVAQTRLVDDLLDVSRIISGKMRIEPSVIKPAEPVAAALDAVRAAALAKSITLSSKLDENAGYIMADPGRIQQIIWNVVGNAVKFTPRSGRVELEVRRSGSYVEIRVSDTGIGIKREFLPQLFQRFSQEDGSIRRSHGGLGLGLAITKHLVELHGGEIHAESQGEGRGAVFRIQLPLVETPGALLATTTDRESSQNAAPAGLRGVRLLLVEDDADSRDVVTAILEDTGVQVTAAETAEQAIELLERVPIDVILSDVGLPGQDGYAFIRSVRANPMIRFTPAAALTAFAHAEDRKRALDAGFQVHLRKPFNQFELFNVIADLAQVVPEPKT